MENDDKTNECVEEETQTSVPESNMKNGEFVVQINGEIGWDITAESISEQFKKADGQDIVIEIASPGGSIFEGVKIFNVIRNYEGNTETRIMGLAASMASYIALASDKVLAEDNATYMIHNAQSGIIGDAEDMKSEAKLLENLNDLLAAEYVKKTGKSEKEILKMMDDETWLFGSEIKEVGFVDEIIVHSDPKNPKKKKTKEDKESALAEAKKRFKGTLLKMNAEIEEKRNKTVSKFSVEDTDILNSIISTLREKATNLKPEDDVSFKVKDISLLIQDLEGLIPAEEETKATEEDESEKEESKEEEKKEESTETGEGKEEGKDSEEKKEESTSSEEEKKEEDSETKEEEKEDKTKESKFSQLITVCEGYKKELDNSHQQMSKFQEKIKNLENEKNQLKGKISKFEDDNYNKILNSTVEKISKFKRLTNSEKLELKQKYLVSKMSKSALEELSRITEDQMFSKLSEQKVSTRPSHMLEQTEQSEDEQPHFSKMSNEDKLDYLATQQAKIRGFVE